MHVLLWVSEIWIKMMYSVEKNKALFAIEILTKIFSRKKKRNILYIHKEAQLQENYISK